MEIVHIKCVKLPSNKQINTKKWVWNVFQIKIHSDQCFGTRKGRECTFLYIPFSILSKPINYILPFINFFGFKKNICTSIWIKLPPFLFSRASNYGIIWWKDCNLPVFLISWKIHIYNIKYNICPKQLLMLNYFNDLDSKFWNYEFVIAINRMVWSRGAVYEDFFMIGLDSWTQAYKTLKIQRNQRI